MISEQSWNDAPSPERDPNGDAPLTPELRETLGNLALTSEDLEELTDALTDAERKLNSSAEQNPEIDAISGELRSSVARLHDCFALLTGQVMQFSHKYEDTMVTL